MFNTDKNTTYSKIEDFLSKVWREVNQRFKAMGKPGQKSKTLGELISSLNAMKTDLGVEGDYFATRVRFTFFFLRHQVLLFV